MATKVKIKGLKGTMKKVGKRAKKIANKALQDEKLATRFKDIMINSIRKNGIMPSGQAVKPVTTAWKQRRNELARYNKTSKYYSPGASKLTFTGKFLTSFRARVVVGFFGRVRYIIGPSGMHKPYNRPDKQTIDKAVGSRFQTTSDKRKEQKEVENTKIGKGQIKQGRDYTELGDDIKAEFRKAAIGRIRRAFKLELAKQGST